MAGHMTSVCLEQSEEVEDLVSRRRINGLSVCSGSDRKLHKGTFTAVS